MSHLIEQITEAVRARLVAAGTVAGSNVAKDRDWPIGPDEGVVFDWIGVNAGDDRVIDSTVPRPRRLLIEVEIRVRLLARVSTADGAPHARVRRLLLEAQLALLGAGADITFGGLAKFTRYEGSTVLEDEQNLDAAGRDATFVVTFQTSEASFEASA
jgi:hypothetical protein